jgi:hypothetical protein
MHPSVSKRRMSRSTCEPPGVHMRGTRPTAVMMRDWPPLQSQPDAVRGSTRISGFKSARAVAGGVVGLGARGSPDTAPASRQSLRERPSSGTVRAPSASRRKAPRYSLRGPPATRERPGLGLEDGPQDVPLVAPNRTRRSIDDELVSDWTARCEEQREATARSMEEVRQDKESPHARRKSAPPRGKSRSTRFPGYFVVRSYARCTSRVAGGTAGLQPRLSSPSL